MAEFLQNLQAHLGDGFVIERELGGGGMSRVVLARDVKLDRRVVIKLLPQSVTATISVERFRREIMLSAAMQHPNIVPVLTSGEFEGLPYFVMPFIEGESLRARMRRGPLSVRETVNILKDVARALVFAHARGVIHRDIKPDNVLLAQGAAVVTDFGVAKALMTASRTSGPRPAGPTITGVGMSPGTPAYMAPEQAAADPNTDHRADLYALGILAYEMLAGTPPFHGRTPQALLAAQLSEKPASLKSRRYDVPAPLSSLIAQCLEKDPALRPETANSVLRMLEDPSMVSGVFDAPIPRAERSRRMASYIALGLLLVAAVVTWRWTARSAAATTDAAAVVPPPVASAALPGDNSIAVVPFDSVGQEAGVAARGLSSELTSAISTLGGLRVVSQASAAAIRDQIRAGTDTGAPPVALMLEGTVQRERNDLRVVVRLVRLANDSTLWTQTFNGAADSTLRLQSTVVNGVMAAVAARAGR